jgi:ComF family protein
MIENPITHKFWGRSNIQYATAFYFYDKDTSRILIHELKYNDRPDIGEKIGHLYGKILKSTHFDEIDCIIPVPLHPKKKKLRGYNQSEAFANGLGEAMNKDVVGGLERGIFTETQTKKGKMERFENMENVFVVTNKTALEGRHLLLVDDVLTTGATLDQCAEELLLIDGVKVSIATIATVKI